jgi:dipeptidyl aminopeptidase/acylaminoacyl peptidase
MSKIWAGLAAGLTLAVSATHLAAAPLAAYGELPTIEQIAVSPSGKLLAIDFVKGEERSIVVQDLTAKKILTGIRMGQTKVRGMEWAGDDHLLIASSSYVNGLAGQGVLMDSSEWIVAADFNLATHKVTPLLGDVDMAANKVVGPPAVRMVGGKPVVFATGFYMARQTDAGAGDVSVTVRTSQLALFRIDLDTDRSTLVTSDQADVTGYVVGDDGRPLAEQTYDATSKQWSLKLFQGGVWHEAQSGRAALERPSMSGLGRDSHTVLISDWEDGHHVLRELTPAGTLSDPLPGPADGAPIRDPSSHEVIGLATLEGDDWRYHFYDPTDQAQWDAVTKAFPGASVQLASASDDRRQIILHVESPTDGPGYALVDLSSGTTTWLGSEFAGLTSADISPVQPVAFKAADGLALSGYLTLPKGRDPRNLPLVVFPHGGPAARDAPGFDWWAQAMASRGYAVLQVNYRGSDGFGWKFMSAGFGEWGGKMQSDLSDGVRYLAKQGTIDPARVCIVGASYGGYAALAGAALDTGVYRCAVDVSGPAELSKFVAWGAARGGFQGVAAERYWDRYMGAASLADPHLEAISPADHADKVAIPVLIIHGKDDSVVPFEQSQIMADALKRAGKPVEMVVLNHEDHWLSHSDTRLQMLQATIDFLARNNPAG